MKAARGAGLPWGIAEEAGYAVGWLHARGWPGASALADLLNAGAAFGPLKVEPGRISDDGASSLEVGAAFSDHAGMLGRKVAVGMVRSPLLLLYFAHQAAVAAGEPVGIIWAHGGVVAGPDGEAWGDLEKLISLEVEIFWFQYGEQGERELVRPGGLPPISRDVVEGLEALATLTTVPATTESRAGAGADDNDND